MKSNLDIRIFFCGPIGQKGKSASGGYAVANRRTIDLLSNINIEVNEYAYPVAGKLTVFYRKIYIHTLGFISLYLNLIFDLIKSVGSKKKRIVHITGLYMGFIYLEFVIALISKLLGVKLIYDIRAGAMMIFYKERSFIYRFFFRMVLSLSDQIMVEGKEYIDFINKLTCKDVFYFPNYIDSSVLSNNDVDDRENEEVIKLLYFGWIKKTKGVELIIEVNDILLKQGYNVELTYIGSGESDYLLSFKNMIANSKNIRLLDGLPHNDLMKEIRKHHFFLFPTNHLGEGHSNALTEAMANGVVPICSSNGFNKSVVDSTGVVLPKTAIGGDYASAILSIWNNNRYNEFSNIVHDRILNHFSSDVIIENLVCKYKTI